MKWTLKRELCKKGMSANYRSLNHLHYLFQVNKVQYAISIHGIWDHDGDNDLGPYNPKT